MFIEIENIEKEQINFLKKCNFEAKELETIMHDTHQIIDDL